MRLLVLSTRLTDRRRAAFQALAQGLAELRFASPGELPPDLGAHDAIVVDGPQPAQPLSTLAGLRATRAMASRSARVTGAEPCASPCTAKAPPATDGPIARPPPARASAGVCRTYVRARPRRARYTDQIRRHSVMETDTVLACWSR